MAKFEVGDKVKIVRMDTKWSAYRTNLNKYIGTIGKIEEKRNIVTDSDPYYDVGMPDGTRWSIKEDWLDLVEKRKTGWNGKVVCVCVKPNGMHYFTPGKIYECKNGFLVDDTNDEANPWNMALPIENFENLKDRSRDYYEFIEFKGFAGK